VQSTLSRAVIFSAMTTGTAFGSLSLSTQPGMSSMGELMGLALICTMGAAVLFQPALMGPPRAVERDSAATRFAPAPSHSAAALEDWGEPESERPRRGGREAEREPVSHRIES
jgi:uncharacterized membrane protein YdfJ with MMPL/SSD domain